MENETTKDQFVLPKHVVNKQAVINQTTSVSTPVISQTTELQAIETTDVYEMTATDQTRFAEKMIKTGLVPKHFDNAFKLITAWATCKAYKINPMTSIRQMYVINGVVTLFGDLPLALVSSSGNLELIEEFLCDVDYKEIKFENKNLNATPFAAVCRVKRKNDPVIKESYFTVLDAEKAGLFRNAVWKSYTGRMLTYRARSQALKDKFPDSLSGISIGEYDLHQTIESVGETKNKIQEVKEIIDSTEQKAHG